MVGSTIKKINANSINKKIYGERATLEKLVEDLKSALTSYEQTFVASESDIEPVYIIFALGIYDLLPDFTPISLLKNLNELVGKMRTLKDELKFYHKSVSNVCFTTAYPADMERLGSGDFTQHAQQFVDMVFRWFNRWVTDLNGFNGTGRCRLDKPFPCLAGKYKLKKGQLADDGINPSDATVKHFEKSLDKYVSVVKERIKAKEPFTSDEKDASLLSQTWSCLKKAESVYLDAVSGQKRTFEYVFMPYASSNIAKSDNSEQDTNEAKAPIGVPAEKGDESWYKTSSSVQPERCTEKASTEYNRIVHRASEDVINEQDNELYVYKVAEQYVKQRSQGSQDVPQKAVTLLSDFRASEKAIHRRREMEDRERIAIFQLRMKNIEKKYEERQAEHMARATASSQTSAVFQTQGYCNLPRDLPR